MTFQKTAFELFKKLPSPVKRMLIKPTNRFNNYKLKKYKTPISLTFFITARCNLKCKHCFYGTELNKNLNDELTLNEIKQIVKSFKHNIPSLSLTGGEPFLREDIVEIFKIFNKYKKTKYSNLVTNGFSPDLIYTQAKRISKLNTNTHIRISLDGLKETHDSIRGIPGSFDKAVETIKRIKILPKISIAVGTTLHKGNYLEVSELINFVKNLGVDHRFQYVRGSTRDVKNIDPKILSNFNPKEEEYGVLLNKEEICRLNDFLNQYEKNKCQELKREYFIKHLYENQKMLDCKAGFLDGVIYPNGDVAMCEMIIPFANLRDFDYNMNKLWNSPQAENMRKKISACYCTHSCNLSRSMYYDEKSLLRLTE